MKWYVCPYCNKKLIKYEKNAQSKGIYIMCKKCKNEIEIKINNKSIKRANEPDRKEK